MFYKKNESCGRAVTTQFESTLSLQNDVKYRQRSVSVCFSCSRCTWQWILPVGDKWTRQVLETITWPISLFLCVRRVCFPEVFPASYFWKEGISRTGGVVHHLSVAVESEVSSQSSSIYRTLDQTMAQQVDGMAGWWGGSVVTNDWHAVPNGIVPPGVCAKVVPTSAFVYVAVRADHKAVCYVAPITNFLMETLHGSHVARAAWEGQTGRRWLVGVVNVEELERQRQRHRYTLVGFCPPLTTRDDLRAV